MLFNIEACFKEKHWSSSHCPGEHGDTRLRGVPIFKNLTNLQTDKQERVHYVGQSVLQIIQGFWDF